MKKSAWISFCGWAVVALGATVLGKAKALLDEAQAVENVPPSPAAGAPAKGSSRTCQVCKTRSAAWFCTAHGVPVCVADLDNHDSPGCVYVPAARVRVVAGPPAPNQRQAAPSVLGLGNA